MSNTTIDKAAIGDGKATSDEATDDGPLLAPAEEETLAAEEESDEARPGPRVRTVRQALGLTQEKFSARYGIPLGTLRDWEQGRTAPDRPARAYIKVIASNPEWVSQALAAHPDAQPDQRPLELAD